MRVITEDKSKAGVAKENKKSLAPDDLDPIAMRVTSHQPTTNYMIKPNIGLTLNIKTDSEDESSDGESCYNSDETDGLENNIKNPDLTGELTSKMCNLSVSEDSDDVIARSPINSTQHTSRSEPYSLDNRKRNNILQNGGQMFEMNPAVNMLNQMNGATQLQTYPKVTSIQLPRLDILQGTGYRDGQQRLVGRNVDLANQSNISEQYSQNIRNITSYNIKPSADVLLSAPTVVSQQYGYPLAGYVNQDQQFPKSVTNIRPPLNNAQCSPFASSQSFYPEIVRDVDDLLKDFDIPAQEPQNLGLNIQPVANNLQFEKSQQLNVLDAVCEQDLEYSLFGETRKAEKNNESLKNFDLSLLPSLVEDVASSSEDSNYGSVANSPMQSWSSQYSATSPRTDPAPSDFFYKNQESINETVVDNPSAINIFDLLEKDVNQDDLELISQWLLENMPKELWDSGELDDYFKDDSTLKSDDSTYGSCVNSPLQALSPYSASSSGSPQFEHCSESCESINVKSPVSDAVKVLQNISQPNISLNVNQLTSFVKQNIPSSNSGLSKNNTPMHKENIRSDSAPRRTEDKQIRPLSNVIVYDNPQAASERLNEMVNPTKLTNQKKLTNFFNIQYIKVSLAFKDDPESLKDGLFKFLNGKRTVSNDRWLSVLFAHIEFLVGMATSPSSSKKQEFAAILTSKKEEMSLLYIACVMHMDLPIAARYIAEKMVQLKKNVNEAYSHAEGNSLIHYVAEQGDTHVKLLAELMQVRDGTVPAFNINYSNVKAQTALHRVVINHATSNTCFATIKHLVDHGAQITKDIYGSTPLNYAVRKRWEPNIIQKLQNTFGIVNIHDCDVNSSRDLAYSSQKQGNMILSLKNSTVSLKTTNKGNHLGSQ